MAAIQRALCGALIAYARQFSLAAVGELESYTNAINVAYEMLRSRCAAVQVPEDVDRSLAEMTIVRNQLLEKWSSHPQSFEEFPPSPTGEYLMLWPGQYATRLQQQRAVVVPSSMRQVDTSAELSITPAYAPNFHF